MDKNSLILDIKNDLNSIKKQVEVTLAKLTVLESMIELDNKLGVSVAEPVAAPVAEPVAVSVAEPVEAPIAAPIEECRDNACIVRESEPEQEMCRDNACIVREQEPESEREVEEEITPNFSLTFNSTSSLLTPNSEVAVPLRNLMSVISLGDKFRFRHDLFSDDNDLFKETIEILNTLEDFTKAVDFLDEKFNWDPEDATVVYFYDIIKPKF